MQFQVLPCLFMFPPERRSRRRSREKEERRPRKNTNWKDGKEFKTEHEKV